MTDRDWLDHWLSQAPALSTETLERITNVIEDGEEDEVEQAA